MTPEEFDALMYEAAMKKMVVHAIDVDGVEYEGRARAYCKADDEEDGYATFCIDDPKINICLGSNELKSLEIVS